MLQAPKLELPPSLIVFVDADLNVQSRYCVYVFLNHGCVFAASRLQHSVAVDITASEAFGFSIAATSVSSAALSSLFRAVLMMILTASFCPPSSFFLPFFAEVSAAFSDGFDARLGSASQVEVLLDLT